MALADQLSIDRLRSGARGYAQRGSAFVRTRGTKFRLSRPAEARPRVWPTAGIVGAAAVIMPWLLVVLARSSDPDLGRGRIVADPWSLLAPAWGAWSLVGLLVVAVVALVAWARLQLPAPDVSRTTAVAVGALVLFAFWCGAAVFFWSPSPSGAWRWAVVAFGVVVATVLGLFAGAQAEGRRGVVIGVMVTGILTALIGVIDLLAFPGTARRVISPLDPTANALVIGLAVVACLALDQSEHPQRRRYVRGAATLGIAALLLTASRGGIAATAFGLYLLAWRGVPVGWPLAQAFVGSLPAVVTAILGGGVARDGIPDSIGHPLVAALLAGGVFFVAWAAARDLGAPAPLRRLTGSRPALLALIPLAVILVVAVSATGRGGIAGTWDHTKTAFQARTTPGIPDDGSRLWSGTSDGRLWRWQAGIDAYQQASAPLQGIGPGSSAVILRKYRREATPNLTIPSSPIALLAESGAIGLVLVLLGVLGLSLAGRAELRREPRSDGVLLLTIGSVALLHSLFNDDLQQPLILIPAFVATAALGARQSVEQRIGPPVVSGTAPGIRSAATVLGTILAIVLALGAVVPARAQLKAREAEADLVPGNGDKLREAALFSNQAARLDPLAFQGDAIGSQAALGLQRWTEARRLALLAVRRGPQEAAAWRALAYVALAEHDRPGSRIAARKLQELDPAAPTTLEIARQATLDSAPPEASPTAIGTPLSATSAQP
ncbi:MAG: hypothetical protein AAGC46_07230 [Solirubrobacteraceae bacterium]